VTRRSRVRFADLPPEVITAIVAAACPDEAAVSAGVRSTCRWLHKMMLSSCTAINLRRFGRGQQIAPLLQRFTGAERSHLISDVLHWCCMHRMLCYSCACAFACRTAADYAGQLRV
jgi:hypothetical protein